MKKLLYILLGVLFVFTACDKDEESNQIDNSIGLVGYCWVPDGNIYKTINGGQYWSVVNAGNYYSHVSFPSEKCQPFLSSLYYGVAFQLSVVQYPFHIHMSSARP